MIVSWFNKATDLSEEPPSLPCRGFSFCLAKARISIGRALIRKPLKKQSEWTIASLVPNLPAMFSLNG